jgi:hypothetical protein
MFRKSTLGHLKPLETSKKPMELIGMDTIVIGVWFEIPTTYNPNRYEIPTNQNPNRY